MKISVLEAKDRLPELIEKAQAGEEVVIANDGQEAVRLVPVPVVPERRYPPGSAEGILEWFRTRPAPSWTLRTPEEIEAHIQAERNAWD